MSIRNQLITAPLLFLLLFFVGKGVSSYYDQRAEDLSQAADRLDHQVLRLERMFRALGDYVVIGDASRSMQIVNETTESFNQRHKHCPEVLQEPYLLKIFNDRVVPLWEETRSKIDLILAKDQTFENEDQRREWYGDLLEKGGLLIEAVVELKHAVHNSAEAASLNAKWVSNIVMFFILVGTLAIFFVLFCAVSGPVTRLQSEIKRLTSGPEEGLSERLQIDMGSVCGTKLGFFQKENEFNRLARSFDMLVGAVRDSLGKRDDALAQVKVLNRKLEQRMEQRVEELDRIFHLSKDVICILGKDGYFQRMNPAFIQILGYPEETLLVTPFIEYIHPDDVRQTEAEYEKYMTPGEHETIDLENRFRHKDGSYRWLQWRAISTEDQIYCVARDITDQKKVMQELRQTAGVVENTTEGVVITDSGGKVLAVNRAFLDISGYSEEEVLGENPRLWKSEHHDESFYQSMWASLVQTGEWRGEIWNRRKSGDAYPALLTINAIYNGDGEITHYVSVLSDISAIKQTQERFQHLAHHDPLTDLPNRLLFNARLEHALERARREQNQVAVLFLDLDNFKSINDSLGHPTGDKLLQKVAKRLTRLLRNEDTVARVAGDEFIIILDDVGGPENASLVAEKLMAAFDEPVQLAAEDLHISFSIGIAVFPDDGGTVTELVKNADAAMYHSKENGRNRFSFYTSDLTAGASEKLRIGNALRGAMARGELSLHYQPQYALADGRLVGAEALLRWDHAELGRVPPDRFIPVAESTGMIIPIGGWVLRTACTQVKNWRDQGLKIERIGVNVAGQQIDQMDILQAVDTVLETTGLDPNVLELEVTETFIMQRAEQAISTLEQLRNRGVTLAIDDFGTGYSSLSYLKRLPLHRLKVDKSFVDGVTDNANDIAIARAVIALARSLDLEVIAEGVETAEQEAFLRTEGCDEAQGYYYSRPLPTDEFTELLRKIV